ncbi:beta-N-acetylhexosaminidase [Zavarzinia sp. CC-PAN008]|uniref:beta-N-acetylhexosaminidase n=1 Tax=Zavarzinia sp. CC-PAN008 TaxID=3243332 RepID=UPI003F7498E9
MPSSADVPKRETLRPEPPRAIVIGCSGPTLEANERELLRSLDPLGFILFARNVVDAPQVRALTADLRETVGRSDAPILIDQEGGRVQRLKPPGWAALPPQNAIGGMADGAGEAAWLLGRLIAAQLQPLGIDVACAPVVDLALPEGHGVIGDRAFGGDPALVAELAAAVAEGLLDGGVLPIVKHIPGHGRAPADSHHALPLVHTELGVLERTDFAPFRKLAHLPVAMTAHVVYSAIDPEAPATTSATLIEDVIREWIGFDGVLLSDDIGMNALSGSLPARTRAALEAGCDVVLHCSGRVDELEDILDVVPRLDADAVRRLRAADRARRSPRPFDAERGLARLHELLQTAVA